MKYALYALYLMMATAATITVIGDVVPLFTATGSEAKTVLLTNIGVFILLGLYCVERAEKLFFKEIDAEENKAEKTDK